MPYHASIPSERAEAPVWPGDRAALPELPDLSIHGYAAQSASLQEARGMQDAARTAVSPVAWSAATDPESDGSHWRTRGAQQDGPRWKVIDAKASEHAYAQRGGRQLYNEDRRLSMMMDALRSRGEYRRLAMIPSDWRNALRKMEVRFPNFIAVVDYLRVMYSLAEHGNRVARLDPMLLVGPPGCGKTYFAEHFAREFGAGSVCLRMENAQTNSQLAGSSEFWSNSRPGEIFNALLLGSGPACANTVFVLDEIDKVMPGQSDPLSSLLALLEPSTAQRFSDLAYPWLVFDASRAVFICTANSADKLSAPLLDRLVRFEIGLPTLQQARRLVRQIHQSLGHELPAAAMGLLLTPKAIDALAVLSPRRIRQVLREGIGRALYRGRKRVLLQDLIIESQDELMERKIGFV